MNNFMIIILLTNIMLIFFTIIENLYKKHEYNKAYKFLNNYVSDNLKKIHKKTKKEYENFLLESKKNEMIIYDFDPIKYNNQKMIRQIMKMSYNLFSEIYNDKNIYCSIRIHKKNNTFLTIAHIKNRKNILNNTIYSIDKNTDLINIYDKRYNIFAITNINDYKKTKSFILQDKDLQINTKAIISIALNDNKKVIGCFTVYFSKPLNEKIEIKKLENIFISLNKSLSSLIKEYIEIDDDLLKIEI